MASDRHDDLDEELDEDPPFEIVVEEIAAPRRPLNLKPFFIGLLILVLGGGLGAVGYLFTNFT